MVANFMPLARGGTSSDTRFLSCYVDYTVSEYLLGSGPTKVTVAYDQYAETRSYDLYVSAHDAGRFGAETLMSRSEYRSMNDELVSQAENELSALLKGSESVVFLAPLGAHNAIAYKSWRAVAQWDLQTEAGVVNAVRYGADENDPEHMQTLTDLKSRIQTASSSSWFKSASSTSAHIRHSDIGDLDEYYSEIGAYGDIGPFPCDYPATDDARSAVIVPPNPPFSPKLPPPPRVKPGTPEPSPTATFTAVPTPIPCSEQTPVPVPTQTTTPTATITSTPSPTLTATPAATSTPTPPATEIPSPTATEVPSPTPSPTSSPEPTATSTPVPTATPTPSPTHTPTPSPTDTPTPAPTPTFTPTPTTTPIPDPNISRIRSNLTFTMMSPGEELELLVWAYDLDGERDDSLGDDVDFDWALSSPGAGTFKEAASSTDSDDIPDESRVIFTAGSLRQHVITGTLDASECVEKCVAKFTIRVR